MRLLLLLFLIAICHISYGQLEISPGLSYEMPLGELGDVYKNAPAYQLSILRAKKYKTTRNSFGARLGYLNMKPQSDTLLFEIYSSGVTEYGKISYSDYQVYQLMMSWRCDKILARKVEFFYGFDAGLHFTVFSYSEKSAYNNDEGTEMIGRGAFSPRTGVNFVLNDHLALGLSGCYTISIGGTEDPKNIINQYLSVGTHLMLRL